MINDYNHSSILILESRKVVNNSYILNVHDLNEYLDEAGKFFEDRTFRHILNVLSEKTSSYSCGDSLTVKQRKSLARHIFQQNINPKSAWTFAVDRIERHEAIVNNFLTLWLTYDASNDTDVPKGNGTKEVHSRNETSGQNIKQLCPSEVTRASFCQEIELKQVQIIKNTLIAINSSKTLEITSKLRSIDKKDIDTVQNFIKTMQARIQDNAFILSNTLALEDQDTV
ncbi:hypothetical protein RMATCC62417_15628 [Rhizopus microsporus]|nr:hypothetical protein RMATCC62417_15628 [Rhizopus microsporus]